MIKTQANRPVLQKDKTKTKKKERSKKKLARDRSAKQSAKARNTQFYMSECARIYLQVLTNPFLEPQGLVCIPDLLDMPSYKVRTFNRGTFSVSNSGANIGNGGIAVVGPSFGSDAVIAYVSSAASTSSVAGACIPSGLSYAVFDTQFPYNQATGTANFQVRLVACGVRVRYKGTELNRGGTYSINAFPSGTNFGTVLTISEMLSAQTTRTMRIDEKWHGATYYPSRNSDYDYTGTFGGPVVTSVIANLVVTVDGANSAASFDYEIVRYYELVNATTGGTVTLPTVTASHSDMPGLQQMRGFFTEQEIVDPGPSLTSRAYEWIRNVSPQDVSHFVNGAAAAYKLTMGH